MILQCLLKSSLQPKFASRQSSLLRYSHAKICNKKSYHLRSILGTQDDLLQPKTSNSLPTSMYLKAFTAKTPIKNIECGFKTSSPDQALPFLQIFFLKPLMRIVPMIAGRKIRKWWKNLSDSDKKKFNKAKKMYISLLGGLGITSFVYFWSHVEPVDILGVKRKRFMALSRNQITDLGTFLFEGELEDHEDDLLPDTDPTYARVATVANRLLKANVDVQQIYGKEWTISVIKDDKRNAFVLPTGNIFVYTGMLNTCTNDDQLGVILGHEMAHSILSHGAEQLAYSNLLSFLMITPFLFLWALLPNDAVALFADWLFRKISILLFELPYSRKLETEADIVGLELASKACFDIREAPAFWAKMQLIELKEYPNIPDLPEYLSTHPCNWARHEYLTDILPDALERRSTCGCDKLTGPDPILEFKDRMEFVKRQKNVEYSNFLLTCIFIIYNKIYEKYKNM